MSPKTLIIKPNQINTLSLSLYVSTHAGVYVYVDKYTGHPAKQQLCMSF